MGFMSIEKRIEMGDQTKSGSSPSDKTRTIVVRLCTLVVVASLLVSGIKHLLQPYFFAHTIASYELVPRGSLGVMALIIPGLQLAIGLSLLTGVVGRAGFYSAAWLFVSFGLAQASVLVRGLKVDCGCFGFSSSEVTLGSAILPWVLALACFAGIWACPASGDAERD